MPSYPAIRPRPVLKRGVEAFLFIRDSFYSNPEYVRRTAQRMKFIERPDVTGYRTNAVYHEKGIRRRLENMLGLKITRWDEDPDEGNGIFFESFSRGRHREVPGIHFDEPYEDITALVYLTPGLPPDCGTSLWRHKSTALSAAPSRKDAHRLNKPMAKIQNVLERDATNRSKWIELDRAGYKYNRLVAYPSGMLHSASRHFGSSLTKGRLYQAFRFGVDWSTCRFSQ